MADYADYLASDRWHTLRLAAIRRDGGACRLCAATSRLQVHHRRYPRNVAFDSLDNLTTLCRACHARVHGRLVDPALPMGGRAARSCNFRVGHDFFGRRGTLARFMMARCWSPSSVAVGVRDRWAGMWWRFSIAVATTLILMLSAGLVGVEVASFSSCDLNGWRMAPGMCWQAGWSDFTWHVSGNLALPRVIAPTGS